MEPDDGQRLGERNAIVTHPTRAAVLGHPVAHSLSPLMHRAGYRALGMDEWTYESCDTTAEQLPERLAMLDDRWAGLSLTMPLKQDALDLMDHIEPLALAVGAMNTVLVAPARTGVELVGANTDVYGITEALREPVEAAGARWALIVGGGATAASAVAALAQLDLRRPVVAVRSPGRSGALVRAAHRLGVEAELVPLALLEGKQMDGPGVVISTLPPGQADQYAPLLCRLAGGGVVMDVAYEPWPTVMCTTSAQLGARFVPGWEMLVGQGLEQFRLFTGKRPPAAAMRAAVEAAVIAKE